MNKSRDKKNNAKIKGCMWCQLLNLILGAILHSKFHYSDVTLVKPYYLNHFHFSFLPRKSAKMKSIQSKCVHTYQVWTPFPLYATVSFCHRGPLLHAYVLYGWPLTTPSMYNFYHLRFSLGHYWYIFNILSWRGRTNEKIHFSLSKALLYTLNW